MWLDALTWDQLVVLLLGVPAIGMTQIESLRRWACFPGLGGQLGWFAGLQPNQPAFFVASVLCCLIWLYSLWIHWLWPMWLGFSALDSATTPTAAASTPRPRLTGAGARKPRLRLVPKD